MKNQKPSRTKRQRQPALTSNAVLGQRELEFLNYLHQQFPATIGHIPLAGKIHAIWQQGMDDAAGIVCERRHGVKSE
jgi:hypothetical protein